MADFVLVHGAWHGAWCWRRVLPLLWSSRPSRLCRLAERRRRTGHLPPQAVTLDTHIADVVNVIEAEELLDAVLVGTQLRGCRDHRRRAAIDAAVAAPGLPGCGGAAAR
jgi:hypothetical protein